MARYAVYGTRETAVTYYNGTGYVVRHDMYPHTTYTAQGPVTRQGHAVNVGARQGLTDSAGFAVRRYTRPDTEPVREF
jgi:hypothetical protein